MPGGARLLVAVPMTFAPGAGQRLGDGLADSAGCAGDQRDVVLQACEVFRSGCGRGERGLERFGIFEREDLVSRRFSMRLTRPASTPPGPHSTIVRDAAARLSAATVAVQRTGLDSWRTSSARMSSGSECSCASTALR